MSWIPFLQRLRNSTGTGTTGTAPAGPLKPSDYATGVALVVGTVGGSDFVASGLGGFADPHTTLVIVGAAGLITTVFTALSQWLQHLGH